MVVPSLRDDHSAALLACISVRSERYPVASGHARGLTLAPSFDLATCLPGGGLRLRRLQTLRLGGWVPSCVDLVVNPTTIVAAAGEGRRVRVALAPDDTSSAPIYNGGASLVEWAREVQWEIDREREAEASPLKARGVAHSPDSWLREATKKAALAVPATGVAGVLGSLKGD